MGGWVEENHKGGMQKVLERRHSLKSKFSQKSIKEVNKSVYLCVFGLNWMRKELLVNSLNNACVYLI